MTDRIRADYDRIAALHAEMLALLERGDDSVAKRRAGISGWSPCEHIHHIAMVNRGIALALQRILADKDVETSGGPNWRGRVVLLTGFIPRGKAKAPATVTPPAEAGPDESLKALHASIKAFERLEPHLGELAAKPGRLPHPLLGLFSGAQWMRFVPMHMRHHQRIVDELIKAAR